MGQERAGTQVSVPFKGLTPGSNLKSYILKVLPPLSVIKALGDVPHPNYSNGKTRLFLFLTGDGKGHHLCVLCEWPKAYETVCFSKLCRIQGIILFKDAFSKATGWSQGGPFPNPVYFSPCSANAALLSNTARCCCDQLSAPTTYLQMVPQHLQSTKTSS